MTDWTEGYQRLRHAVEQKCGYRRAASDCWRRFVDTHTSEDLRQLSMASGCSGIRQTVRRVVLVNGVRMHSALQRCHRGTVCRVAQAGTEASRLYSYSS